MYGIEHCYTDLEEMIRTECTDVIHITTPPQTHAALRKIKFFILIFFKYIIYFNYYTIYSGEINVYVQ